MYKRAKPSEPPATAQGTQTQRDLGTGTLRHSGHLQVEHRPLSPPLNMQISVPAKFASTLSVSSGFDPHKSTSPPALNPTGDGSTPTDMASTRPVSRQFNAARLLGDTAAGDRIRLAQQAMPSQVSAVPPGPSPKRRPPPPPASAKQWRLEAIELLHREVHLQTHEKWASPALTPGDADGAPARVPAASGDGHVPPTPRVLVCAKPNAEKGWAAPQQWPHVRALISTQFQAALPDRVAPGSGDVAELLSVHDPQRRWTFFGIDMHVMDILVDTNNAVCELVLPSTGQRVRLASPAVPSTGLGAGQHTRKPHVQAPESFTQLLQQPMLKHCRVAFSPSEDVLHWTAQGTTSFAEGSTKNAQAAAGASSQATATAAPVGPTNARHSTKRERSTEQVQPAVDQYFATASAAAACVDQIMRLQQPTERFRIVNYRTPGSREMQYVPLVREVHPLLLNEALLRHALATQ